MTQKCLFKKESQIIFKWVKLNTTLWSWLPWKFIWNPKCPLVIFFASWVLQIHPDCSMSEFLFKDFLWCFITSKPHIQSICLLMDSFCLFWNSENDLEVSCEYEQISAHLFIYRGLRVTFVPILRLWGTAVLLVTWLHCFALLPAARRLKILLIYVISNILNMFSGNMFQLTLL